MTKRVLKRLSRQPGVCGVLVSGRAPLDLKRMVGVPRLCYVGNHGLELEGDGLRYVHPQARAHRPLLRRVARTLTIALRPVPGAWVEDKGLTVSLHWRAVPRAAHRALQQRVARAIAPYRSRRQIVVTRGKRVIDIRPPVRWGKGEAVDWLSRHLRPSSSSRAQPTLLYFGDDQTDEGAFRAVNRSRGISVFVGPRPRATYARWWARDPREVREALTRILHERWKVHRLT
jgi:trehalose-phosphatase